MLVRVATPTCRWVETQPNGEDKLPQPLLQHGTANLNGLRHTGEGTEVQPPQRVHQSRLGVDGHGQNGHRDSCVRVGHGRTQLQLLARPEAPQPRRAAQGLISVAGSRVLDERNEGGFPLPVFAWTAENRCCQ